MNLIPFVHGKVALALSQKQLLVGREGENVYRTRQIHLSWRWIDDDSTIAVFKRYCHNSRCRSRSHRDGGGQQG